VTKALSLTVFEQLWNVTNKQTDSFTIVIADLMLRANALASVARIYCQSGETREFRHELKVDPECAEMYLSVRSFRKFSGRTSDLPLQGEGVEVDTRYGVGS
jgi:hypothetical protein